MTFHTFNIGDLLGGVALWNDFQKARKGGETEKAAEIIRQRLPNIFGFGRADEQLFESLRQLMQPNEKRFIDLVVGKMRDYEAGIFRLTITGMSCGSEVVKKTVNNPKKGQPTETKETLSWELTEKDLRVKYLSDIAGEVSRLVATGDTEKAAAASVVKAMRKRRLITRSPAAQKAYELWVDATEWVKKNVLDFFGVQNFGEITDTLVAEKINRVADKVPVQSGSFSLNPFRGIGTTIKKYFL